MISQQKVPIRSACSSLNISKSAYYGSLKKSSVDLCDRQIKNAIYDISLEYPKYGYRRITAELHRRGQIANHNVTLQVSKH